MGEVLARAPMIFSSIKGLSFECLMGIIRFISSLHAPEKSAEVGFGRLLI